MNIMYDPRVYRGSSYSTQRNASLKKAQAVPAPPVPGHGRAGGGESGVSGSGKMKKKQIKWKEKTIYDHRPPLASEAVDLTEFLVEQEEEKSSAVVETQTDQMDLLPLDKPYIPRKTGVDTSTQMTPDDQPFHFDRDVAPLLEVVVQKTLEQSLLEVEQEEELQALAADLARLEEEKKAEEERVAALEAASAQKFVDMKEKKREERERRERQDRVRSKVASLRLMKQVWPEVIEGAARGLEEIGTWRSPITHVIRRDVLPWLYQQVDEELHRKREAEKLVDDLLHFTMVAHEEAASARIAEQHAAREAEKRKAEKRGWIRIFLQASSLGIEEDQMVGPIQVSETDTIEDVEAKIAEWLTANDIKVELPEQGLLHLAMNGRELPQHARLLDEQIGDNSELQVVLPQSGGSSGEESGGGGGGEEAQEGG